MNSAEEFMFPSRPTHAPPDTVSDQKLDGGRPKNEAM